MPASRRLPPRRGAGGTLDPACVRPLQPRTPEDSQLMWRVDSPRGAVSKRYYHATIGESGDTPILQGVAGQGQEE
jgi:hypothetical protein